MRHEPLIGYLLHQRPYRESRALYILFSEQHGVVHGVGRKGMPLFACMQLFATGKQSLKTFSQLQLVGFKAPLIGKNQYVGFYINELLYKLLPVEDTVPKLWQAYEHCIDSLRQNLSDTKLRIYLRQFEWQLLTTLGVVVSFEVDALQRPIVANQYYRFVLETGFVPIEGMSKEDVLTKDDNLKKTLFSGQQILTMQQGIQERELSSRSVIHKLMINHLLGYRPLQSRLLWQQQSKY